MSLGKLVIGTRVGGIPEQIEHLVPGVLVEPKDPDGLCRALQQLTADPALRALIGSSARSRFLSRFTVGASV